MYVEEVKDLLKHTELKFTDIAARVGVSSRTVQNINNGKTHRKAGEIYPIRFSAARMAELRERLATPTKSAVKRPNVLSPQLLDYIGMLALLDVNINCLLEFREVYDYQVEAIFGRKLTDDELLSVISLRPTVPHQFYTLIEAYHNPKVKFINIPFWIESGFIQKEEESIIYSLFK